MAGGVSSDVSAIVIFKGEAAVGGDVGVFFVVHSIFLSKKQAAADFSAAWVDRCMIQGPFLFFEILISLRITLQKIYGQKRANCS